MENYGITCLGCVEIGVAFPECTVKFSSMQSMGLRTAVQSLVFHRVMNVCEYDRFSAYDLPPRFRGYLFPPELDRLTEQQRNACALLLTGMSFNRLIVAETIDEKAQSVFLIVSKHLDNVTAALMNNFSFGLFEFKFEELWSLTPGIVALVKNLHFGNLTAAKQLLDIKSCMQICKEYIGGLKTAQANKAMTCQGLYKEIKNKKREEKERKKEITPGICVICEGAQKNVVFLPCGHIAVCKECAMNEMELELCKMFYRKTSSKCCIVCEKRIKEAREVFL
jgi:hypothetical protein